MPPIISALTSWSRTPNTRWWLPPTLAPSTSSRRRRWWAGRHLFSQLAGLSGWTGCSPLSGGKGWQTSKGKTRFRWDGNLKTGERRVRDLHILENLDQVHEYLSGSTISGVSLNLVTVAKYTILVWAYQHVCLPVAFHSGLWSVGCTKKNLSRKTPKKWNIDSRLLNVVTILLIGDEWVTRHACWWHPPRCSGRRRGGWSRVQPRALRHAQWSLGHCHCHNDDDDNDLAGGDYDDMVMIVMVKGVHDADHSVIILVSWKPRLQQADAGARIHSNTLGSEGGDNWDCLLLICCM